MKEPNSEWNDLARRLMEEAAEEQAKLDAIVQPDPPADEADKPQQTEP